MDLGLAGKVALVLGAGGGLGRAIAAALAGEGARVAVADRDARALADVTGSLREEGAEVLDLVWDMADPRQLEPNIARIEEHWSAVDVLINNTGGPAPGPISDIRAAAWREGFEALALPVFAITARVLPRMRAAGWGRIVTSASSGVVAPIPNLGMSNALRSSLLGWSKTLAREEAAHGITVNVVVPGRIATNRTLFLDQQRAKRDNTSLEQVQASSTASIPAGRYGDPAEYGRAVTFLASSAASYITGSILRVDGGYIPSI